MYLTMGMTPKEFWDEDVWLAVYYREAYREKLKRENELAWLQGLYNYNAFSVAIGNAFGSKHKKYKYFEKPISLYKTEAEIAEETKKDVVNQLTAFKRAWDRWQKKQE